MRNYKTKRHNKSKSGGKNNKTRKHYSRKHRGGGLMEMFNNLKEHGRNMLNKAHQKANIIMGKKPLINTAPQSPDENSLERFNKAQENLDNNPNVYADPNAMNGGKYKKKSHHKSSHKHKGNRRK
jgi:hypothetical protein